MQLPRYTQIPAITGKRLIKLLRKDGWVIKRRANHGVSLIKKTSQRILVTVVPDTSTSIPNGTLSKILGHKQTKLGKGGLLLLINMYGL